MAIVRVQQPAGGNNAASLTVSGTAPTSGNLLVAWANSDATVTLAAGGGATWTAGPTIVDGNGTYMWWKVANASEPTGYVFTPSASDYVNAGWIEYSGLTATPLDVSSSTSGSGAGTSSPSVSVTTTAAGDLVVAASLMHSTGSITTSGPSWTNSFANIQSVNASSWCNSYVGELVAGAAGAYATVCSWTSSMNDRQALIMAFKAAAGAAFKPRPNRPSGQAVQRSYAW